MINLRVIVHRYVRIHYYPFNNLSDLAKRFSQESLKPNPHQFVEALLYTRDSGVLMLGDMVDEVGRDGKVRFVIYFQIWKRLKVYFKLNWYVIKPSDINKI